MVLVLFLSEEEGEQINFRGTRMLVKVSTDDSKGKYSLIEMTRPPRMCPALHIHPHAPEAYYVLEGEYSILCGKKIYRSKAGDFVFILKGCPHSYQSGPK